MTPCSTQSAALETASSASPTYKLAVDVADDLGIRLPSTIPQSWVVYGKDTEFDDRQRAHELWKKYIMVGSALEININSGDRHYYEHLLGDLETFRQNTEYVEEELIELFVPCCKQMISYLNSAFHRFEQSSVYKRHIQRKLSHKA